jgi:radical SAM superfamily enzyme YgiQ (UPF0313 family)
MKVTLIYLDQLSAMHPTGVLYLATYLHEKGFSVDIIGIDPKNKNAKAEFISEIEKSKPDMVGISLVTRNADRIGRITEVIKQMFPKCFIVCGGPHPTVLPELTLKQNPLLDCVAIGEGEIILLELSQRIKDKRDISDVKGIAFQKQGKVYFTEPQPYIQNLDILPFPNRDLLRIDITPVLRSPYLPLPPPQLDLMAVRGCPYKCSFCYSTASKIFGSKIRSRTPENVIAELKLLKKKYNIKGAQIGADTFTATRKWALRFCDLLIQEKLNIRWYVNARIDNVDEDILKMMKKAGCEVITLAIESGSDRIRNDVLNKKVSREQISRAFELANKVGILTQANIMVGSPTETIEDLEDSIKLIDLLEPDFLNSSYSSILPGTTLWEKYSDKLHFNSWSELDIEVPKQILHTIQVERLAEARAYLETNYARYGKHSLKKFLTKSLFRNIMLYRWLCYLKVRPQNILGDIYLFSKVALRSKAKSYEEYLTTRKDIATHSVF